MTTAIFVRLGGKQIFQNILSLQNSQYVNNAAEFVCTQLTNSKKTTIYLKFACKNFVRKRFLPNRRRSKFKYDEIFFCPSWS